MIRYSSRHSELPKAIPSPRSWPIPLLRPSGYGRESIAIVLILSSVAAGWNYRSSQQTSWRLMGNQTAFTNNAYINIIRIADYLIYRLHSLVVPCHEAHLKTLAKQIVQQHPTGSASRVRSENRPITRPRMQRALPRLVSPSWNPFSWMEKRWDEANRCHGNRWKQLGATARGREIGRDRLAAFSWFHDTCSFQRSMKCNHYYRGHAHQ